MGMQQSCIAPVLPGLKAPLHREAVEKRHRTPGGAYQIELGSSAGYLYTRSFLLPFIARLAHQHARAHASTRSSWSLSRQCS
jgi:hypothetical protein